MNNEILEYLQSFAGKHSLILETHGEVGFGRPCVGFIAKGGNYLDYSPYSHPDYEPIKRLEDDRFSSYAPKNAYHKHDCFAVLVNNEDYDKALTELYNWIVRIKQDGEVKIVSYETGAQGTQALFTGTIGYAMAYVIS